MGVDIDAVRRKIATELPAHVRWTIHGTSLDFDFSRAQNPLVAIDEKDLNGCDIPGDWTVLRLFGDESYAARGGASPFLGVHVETGQIYGLDVERGSSELFLLNSDVDKFIATFKLFDQALGRHTLPPEEIAALAEAVDPVAFSAGEWRDLADYVTSS